MVEQFDEIKDRAIASYTQFARQNPKTHKAILLAASILGYLYRLIIQCSRRHLDNICLFFCFLLFIFIIYYIQLPIWAELLLGLSIFLVATIGVSFLDYKEKLYEGLIEEKQLEDTRKLLTLGVEGISGKPQAPALPAATVAQQYQPHQITIGNMIKFLGKSSGFNLSLNHLESTDQLDNYVFDADNPVKGTTQLRQLNKLALQLQNSLNLRGLPRITANNTEVSVAISNDWLTTELLNPAKE